jgi:hypothetical protein
MPNELLLQTINNLEKGYRNILWHNNCEPRPEIIIQ